jgi:hypothetical protein
MEADTLMYIAANYYITSFENKEWERPTKEEEQIIALEAQVKQLEANAANYNNPSRAPQGTKSRNATSGNNRNIKPPWMTKPPKPDEPKMKIINGKEYFWCPNHQA